MFSPPDNQDGGHIILFGCHGGYSQVTNVGVVRQLSDQWVHISKIEPQQQQQCGALVDLRHVTGKNQGVAMSEKARLAPLSGWGSCFGVRAGNVLKQAFDMDAVGRRRSLRR